MMGLLLFLTVNSASINAGDGTGAAFVGKFLDVLVFPALQRCRCCIYARDIGSYVGKKPVGL